MEGSTRYPCQILHILLEEFWPGVSIEYPKYCIELPKLLVTPTRMIVAGFDVETSNRVVREFIQRDVENEDFLRVTFCEEDGSRLMNDDFKSEQISNRIKSLLSNGLNLNGNKYRFLAYSSSQLKESSVWMVNCSRNISLVKEIRSWMGDFSSIRLPSKYAARMGQCFSTTFETLPGVNITSRISESSNSLKVYDDTPDVYSKTSSCHSDGTGLIRRDVLKKVLEKVPSVTACDEVSIIQIRFGGAKGTLTAWDNISSLHKYDVCLRQSMVKFPAPYNNLEIIKVGKHIPYYLNRQMIMLLSVHNVPSATFLEMQSVMLNELDNMMIDRNRAFHNLLHLSGISSETKSQLLHMLECG